MNDRQTLEAILSVVCRYLPPSGISREQAMSEIISLVDPPPAQPSDSVEQEPLEYWNAVEGWVKIDEVRQHFETVSCGTIYKNAGEGRVPLYTTPLKREWVRLTDEEIDASLKSCNTTDTYKYFRAIEAKLKEKNT